MLMKTNESRRCGGELRAAGWAGWLAVAWLCGGIIGCGPAPEGGFEEEPQAKTGSEQKLEFPNGLNLNGLSLNGLNLNGLSLNGLSLNGLNTTDFADWFRADPAGRNETMKYVVACAVPAGERRVHTDAANTTYAWDGLLGLAPNWSAGNRATEEELQVVSACMAAHANKFGIHVNISLRGRNGAGTPLSFSLQEDTNYNLHEGCFFGNLFDGQTGVFSGNDGLTLGGQQSSPRVCALSGAFGASQCQPMTFVGSCATYCTRDSGTGEYSTCTYNNVTYKPLTTRMKGTDLYTCGNGVCEVTESASTCRADC
jgi:hypothetical protein